VKVVVTTIVSLNPGDAAILLGTVRLLRDAFGEDVEVTTLDKDGGAASRLYPWMRFGNTLFTSARQGPLARRIEGLGFGHALRRFEARRLRVGASLAGSRLAWLARLILRGAELDTIRTYLHADLVLASGGTYLVPEYGLDGPLHEYEFVRHLDKPLGFMPQSLGPFTESPYIVRIKEVFESAEFVAVRDERSMQHLRQIGISNSRVIQVPDSAFALARPGGDLLRVKGPPPEVGISVRELGVFGGDRSDEVESAYFKAVGELVTWLVREANVEVVFISSCQGIPEYRTDDAVVADGIVRQLPTDVAAHVRVDHEFRQPEELIKAFASFRLVIATRMHAAILAIASGTPVVAIAYEFKTEELFKGMGLDDLVHSIHDISGRGLVDSVQSILADEDSMRETFENRRLELLDRARGVVPQLRRAGEEGTSG